MINDNTMRFVIDNLEQNLHGRKVVFYGKDLEMKNYLEEKGIQVEKIFSANQQILEDTSYKCYPYQELEGKSHIYYVILPYWLNDGGKFLDSRMILLGYKKDVDYCFGARGTIVGVDGSYVDIYGNEIVGSNRKIKFSFSGKNNKIIIGQNINVEGDLHIRCLGNGHLIKIGNENKFIGNSVVTMHNHESKIIIGHKCIFRKNDISCFEKSCIEIESNCDFGVDTKLVSSPNSKVMIKQDCMFSWGIQVISGDGHAIFDLHTNERINSGYEEHISKIEFGEHVWVGARATILGGAIGDGCVIGAQSLVKAKFPNNTIIAGIPARVVKKDIAWSRKSNTTDIADCGGYTNYTEL